MRPTRPTSRRRAAQRHRELRRRRDLEGDHGQRGRRHGGRARRGLHRHAVQPGGRHDHHGRGHGTINNDDTAAATLAIAATDADKAEGNSGSTPFTFTVTRSGDTSGASSVNYAVTGSGTNAATRRTSPAARCPAAA